MANNHVLEARRRRLLEAIGQTDLNAIHARVTGSPSVVSYQFLRRAILQELGRLRRRDAALDRVRPHRGVTL